MRKALLVTFVGIVLAINLFGLAKEFVSFIFEDTTVESTVMYME